MKEFKGTRGEWWLPHFADKSVKCDCQSVLNEHLGGAIAKVYYDKDGTMEYPQREEAEANARLIATAPDLLEALQKLVAINRRKLDSAASWSINKFWFKEMWDETERAEQAINKALGN